MLGTGRDIENLLRQHRQIGYENEFRINCCHGGEEISVDFLLVDVVGNIQ